MRHMKAAEGNIQCKDFQEVAIQCAVIVKLRFSRTATYIWKWICMYLHVLHCAAYSLPQPCYDNRNYLISAKLYESLLA